MEIQLLSSASSLFSRNPGNYGKSWPSCQSFPGLRDGPWCSLALFLLVNNLFWICILQRIPAACKSCGRKTGYKSWRRRKDWTSGYSWPLRKPQEGHRLGSRCQHQKCKNEAFELLSWSVSRPPSTVRQQLHIFTSGPVHFGLYLYIHLSCLRFETSLWATLKSQISLKNDKSYLHMVCVVFEEVLSEVCKAWFRGLCCFCDVCSRPHHLQGTPGKVPFPLGYLVWESFKEADLVTDLISRFMWLYVMSAELSPRM